MKKGLLLVIIVLLAAHCTQRKTMHITEFSPERASNAILIDVRTPEEYQNGHLEEALNINWYDADFKDQVRKLDQSKTVYVYCKLGGRSAKAAAVMDSLGFEVIDLAGGYDAYMAED